MKPTEDDFKHFRQGIVDFLRREVFGPSIYDSVEVQEELIEESPLQRYGTGILFPRKARVGAAEEGDLVARETSLEQEPEAVVTDAPPEVDAGGRNLGSAAPDDAPVEQPLNLANEFSPSAMGITFRTVGCDEVLIDVMLGTYEVVEIEKPHKKAGELKINGTPYPATFKVRNYRRKPLRAMLPVSVKRVGVQKPLGIPATQDTLKLHATVRGGRTADERTVSLMLVNHRHCAGNANPSVSDAFYQVEFVVATKGNAPAFTRIDRPSGGVLPDEQTSMDLLYRHRQSFALGHGCAGDWQLSDGETDRARSVRTACLPCHEIRPIRPREKSLRGREFELSMRFLCDGTGATEGEKLHLIIGNLTALADDYAGWIDDMEKEARFLTGKQAAAATKHLEACRKCLNRMREGIAILDRDPEAMLAFRIANRAMLMQQHHSSLPSREPGTPVPPGPDDGKDDVAIQRRWRPFQLAFILMNIAGAVAPDHPDRRTVDLIWFPTGGGKTEAYLGLSAFTIAHRRLKNTAGGGGTSVLMRYTLRLLTAQQFQRASTLVLALELLRRERFLEANLGDTPVSIGLWVGKSLSPNKRSEALAALKELRSGKGKNPFQVLQCPWCRVPMDRPAALGYVEERVAPGGPRSVRFRCPDRKCRWGDRSSCMPILVVDEDLYDSPPNLLLGTVDKFAQIAWVQETGRLFGVGLATPPPDLIIQDELHLISGPLGSIVGQYETAIERLCTREGQIPKIMAATATIRRSAEQCRNLYARESFEFPPPGLRAGDSYFAIEDVQAPGRLYVGVFASGLKSHATAQVRVGAALLQSVTSLKGRDGLDHETLVDPFGTLVWYFNSLRELGHAMTLCYSDIQEYLINVCKRNNVEKESRRRLKEVVELTSRRTADDIPRILKQLELPWAARPEGDHPIDVLLASNMISVGVDIPRLSLMVVTGQPKSTSEYIQATSRVGRKYPGIVVTVYNQTKSRDRSHFEQFVAYHQSIYRFVEPTSVTPFSPPARDRGLRGLLVALARLRSGVEAPDRIEGKLREVREEIKVICDRIGAVDPAELAEAEEELAEALSEWRRTQPPEFGKMAGQVSSPTLMRAHGSRPDTRFQQFSWPAMTSMRSVDGTSQARVLLSYDTAGNESGDE